MFDTVKNTLEAWIVENNANWVQTVEFVMSQCNDDVSDDQWREVARIYKPYKKPR